MIFNTLQMALGKSLENILGNYFGEANVTLKTNANNNFQTTVKKNNPVKSKKNTDPFEEDYSVNNSTSQRKNTKSLTDIAETYPSIQIEPKVQIQSNPTADQDRESILTLKIDSINPNPYQTRTFFDEEKILSLAANIKENGLIQPIVVLKKNQGNLILLAGERRLRACRLLGWQSILCVIKYEDEVDDSKQSLIAVMENLQREDLSPIELANTFTLLMKMQKTDENGVANLIEKSVQYVRNYLRLLTLHPQVKEFLNTKKLTEGQARHIIGLDPEMQLKIALITIEQDLTVKEVSRLLDNMFNPQNKDNLPMRIKGFDLPQEYIQNSIKFSQQIPNSQVKYFGTKDKGKIVISWGK
jgi:ParB family transcriptional regulator, chromosome partitioning protein